MSKSMNQALIDEITRFALYTYNSKRLKILEEKTLKEDDEYIYKIFLEVFQRPSASTRNVINSFLNKVRFSRLLKAEEENEIKEMAYGAGRLTPEFLPNGG